MKIMRRFGSIVVLISLFLGCATHAGTNRQTIADSTQGCTLPYRIIVSDKSRDIVSAPKMVGGDPLLPIALFGIGGALAMSDTGVALIRGKFAAGEAFESSADSISISDPGSQATLQLTLTRFEHFLGLSPKKRHGIQAVFEFTSAFPSTNKVTVSGYIFDWENKGAGLFPGQEKDLLREMLEYGLMHWCHALANAGGDQAFPAVQQGELSTGDLNCEFRIFETQ